VNATDVMEVAREAVVVMLKVASPVLLLALFVGLIISLFQALTQMQEMTLTFVPKALVIFISLLIFVPYMLGVLTVFTEGLMDRIIALG
jgi:flagellar biosynthetic protein FliQ